MNKDKQGTACDAVLIDKDGTMCRMRCGANRQRKEGGRRNMLNHANKVSGHGNSPQRVSGRWNPNARDERTLTERSGDDSPIGLLSKEREYPPCTKQSMGKEGNIYFHGRESIHEESR